MSWRSMLWSSGWVVGTGSPRSRSCPLVKSTCGGWTIDARVLKRIQGKRMITSASPASRTLMLEMMRWWRLLRIRPATRSLMMRSSWWRRHVWLVETRQAGIRNFSPRVKKDSSVKIWNRRLPMWSILVHERPATPHAAFFPRWKHRSSSWP